MTKHDKLVLSITNLSKLKGSCYSKLLDDLDLSEMSLKQINYLKVFYEHPTITTSQLAETLNLSKPTVTEMVKRFVKSQCVVKQSCPMDGRVYYLKLTEKGQQIARLDELTSIYLAASIEKKLDDQEIELLIKLLEKLA